MFANGTVNESPSQNRANTHQISPVRVIPLTTAEAAPQSVAALEPVAAPEVKVSEKQVEKLETRKAEPEERAHKKRLAERKARKARQQVEARLRAQPRPEPGVMAFSEEPRQVSFFGN